MSIKLLKPRELPGFCRASHFKESTQRPLLIVWPQTPPLDSEWECLKSAPSVGSHTTGTAAFNSITPAMLEGCSLGRGHGGKQAARQHSYGFALLNHQSKIFISDHPRGGVLSTPCHVCPDCNECHQPALKITMVLAALCLWLCDHQNNNRNDKSLLS